MIISSSTVSLTLASFNLKQTTPAAQDAPKTTPAISATTPVDSKAAGTLPDMGTKAFVWVENKDERARQMKIYGELVQKQLLAAEKGNKAMDTIHDRLEGVQQRIAKQRPQLAKVTWDFALKDGRLQVSGNVSKADQAWLERELNGDASLVDAAEVYSDAVAFWYQGTPDNLLIPDVYCPGDQIYDQVKKGINGNLPLRAIAAKSWYSEPRVKPSSVAAVEYHAKEYLKNLNLPRYVAPPTPPSRVWTCVGELLPIKPGEFRATA